VVVLVVYKVSGGEGEEGGGGERGGGGVGGGGKESFLRQFCCWVVHIFPGRIR